MYVIVGMSGFLVKCSDQLVVFNLGHGVYKIDFM